jgi:hypothetical protein
MYILNNKVDIIILAKEFVEIVHAGANNRKMMMMMLMMTGNVTR